MTRSKRRRRRPARRQVVLALALLVCAASVAAGMAGRSRSRPLPPLTVEVLNGCGVDGLAARVAERLRQLGQDALVVADAPTADHERTVLIDRRGRPWLTRALAERIGPVLVVLERVDDAPADVTLILGADHADLRVLADP